MTDRSSPGGGVPTSVSAQTTEIVPITPLTSQNEVTQVCACTQTQTHTHKHTPAYFRLSLIPLPLIAYPNTSRLEKKIVRKKSSVKEQKSIALFAMFLMDQLFKWEMQRGHYFNRSRTPSPPPSSVSNQERSLSFFYLK